MKLIIAVLLITTSAIHAQMAADIQNDFTQTFNYFFDIAKQFIDKLATLLDDRFNQYIVIHQKLIDNFRSVQLISNVTLDANNLATLNEIISKIESLIGSYRKVFDRNIFNQELNKYTTLLQTQYLSKAQVLIDELKNYVTKFPVIGKCWSDNKAELTSIVENGFNQAKNVVLSAVQGANSTLNINELLVNGVIAGNDAFLNICKSSPSINDCVSTFLNVATITLLAGSGLWELTTNLTVSVNLGITETQIVGAISTAVLNIEQIVRRIEACVTNSLVQG
ncbi:hypothetical protein PVAND_010780 [Polypedilum vanderplanki]|uniref:Uncharacterized protein n=1 Tax=Polypedilum vanderplanki TaxID=319348 RepID=A0A9J6CHI7_POLVA|nr:hypothetical protein PVAND_010780 [Polypedilum vanderplanki]